MARRKKVQRKQKFSRLKIIALLVLLMLTLVGCTLWYTASVARIGRNDGKVYIYIKAGISLSEVRQQIQKKVWPRYPRLLDLVIQYKGLEKHLRAGRYELTPEMSAIELVETLTRGPQTPVEVPLAGVRTMDELIDRFDEYLMLDRQEIDKALTDSSVLRLEGLNAENVRSLFFAQKYKLYWNTTGQALMDSIRAVHNRYWTPERRAKADSLRLTTAEIATLASIIESESAKTKEFGVIARLYINRYNKGMLLQSDPTVKFALGDFSIRRILLEHLRVESPYNTYRVKGLPPGPIRLPRTSSIDAVLEAPKHNYIYMCAKEDFSGYHNFATDYATHQANARRYQEALNKRGIMK